MTEDGLLKLKLKTVGHISWKLMMPAVILEYAAE